MAFRSTPIATATFATPTSSIDVGDAAVAGVGPFSASSQHQHAFPAAALATALAPGGPADLSASFVSQAAAAGLLNPGGPLALTFAQLPAASDAVQFVSRSIKANDANDGGSFGTAKATTAAALAALPVGADGQATGRVVHLYGDFDLGSAAVGLSIGYGGFTLEGQGEAMTRLNYTGTGTGMRFANYATANQKTRTRLLGFTLNAPNAAIGLDLKGSTYGHATDVEVVGAATIGTIVAGSVGIKYDGSYGALIGCWWNVLDGAWRVSGFETGVQFTGAAGAGQANQNFVFWGRVNAYSRAGIDVDVGDNVFILGTDVTTGTPGTVPTKAGVRLNGLSCKALGVRFENIGSGGVCVLLDGVGTKVADRCLVDWCVFATEAGSIAVQINANARECTIGLEQMFSRSPAVTQVVDNGLGGLTTWSTYGRGMTPYRFSIPNAVASMPSVDLDPRGSPAGNNRDYVGRPYQCRATKARLSTAITAGTMTITPTIGGVAAGPALILTSASGTAAGTGQQMGLNTDPGTGGLGCIVTTSAGFAPAGLTANIEILVEHTQ